MGPMSSPNLNNQGMYPGGISSEEQEIGNLVKLAMDEGKSEQEAIASVIEKLGIVDSLIVFFGFQGLLANTFSWIGTKEQEEIKMRLFAIDDSVSPVFMSVVDFYIFYSKYNVPEGTINPIKIDDAFATLRLGEKKKEEKFEDVEVDEFDDNCTDECIPGNHQCSKRK